MTKPKGPPPSDYPEIQEIRDDLGNVVTNVVGLGHHLQEDGVEKVLEIAEELKDSALEVAGKIVARGEHELSSLEKRIKKNPVESVLLAFAGGAIASLFLGRKR